MKPELIIMGKTTQRTAYNKDGKEEKLVVLQKKLADRKEQVKRLKAYIKELEKKLEDKGNPVKESKLDRPKKLSPEEKKRNKELELENQKKDIIQKMKAKYGRKTSSDEGEINAKT